MTYLEKGANDGIVFFDEYRQEEQTINWDVLAEALYSRSNQVKRLVTLLSSCHAGKIADADIFKVEAPLEAFGAPSCSKCNCSKDDRRCMNSCRFLDYRRGDRKHWAKYPSLPSKRKIYQMNLHNDENPEGLFIFTPTGGCSVVNIFPDRIYPMFNYYIRSKGNLRIFWELFKEPLSDMTSPCLFELKKLRKTSF